MAMMLLGRVIRQDAMWLVSRRKNPALVAFLMLLLGLGADAESATTKVSQNITTAQTTSVAASEGQLSELKLKSEIAKLQAEIASIQALGERIQAVDHLACRSGYDRGRR